MNCTFWLGHFKNFINVAKSISLANKWATKSGAMQQGYHSGTFTGGDVKKMLENIGFLENMSREESSFIAMRFVSAFRALDWVRKICSQQFLEKTGTRH